VTVDADLPGSKTRRWPRRGGSDSSGSSPRRVLVRPTWNEDAARGNSWAPCTEVSPPLTFDQYIAAARVFLATTSAAQLRRNRFRGTTTKQRSTFGASDPWSPPRNHTSLNGTGYVRNSRALSAPELHAVKGGHEVSAISATCSLVTVLGTSFSSVWHQPAKGKLVKRKRGIRYAQWSGSSDQCCVARCWTRFHAATFVLF
jgi:hypothetical protein